MPRVTRRGNIGRPQFQACQSGRHIEAGLGLRTDRLQREGVIGTAYQRIGADADADRGVALHAAVVSGKVARMDHTGRCEHRPAQRHVLRNAKVDPDAADDAEIVMRRTAACRNEHALEVKRRTDHVTDPAVAAAGEAADLDIGLGAGWRGRHQHCCRDRRKTCCTYCHDNLPVARMMPFYIEKSARQRTQRRSMPATPAATFKPDWPCSETGCNSMVRLEPPMSTFAPTPATTVASAV